MIRFEKVSSWAWSFLVICTLAFALGGCEGDTGPAGPPGADGVDGVDGVDGTDGVDGVLDDVQLALEKSNVESCGTCHEGIGGHHQAVYDEYTDDSEFVLTIDNVASAANVGGGFDVTIDFSIDYNNMPYIDPVGSAPSVTAYSFYVVKYDSTTGEFLQPGASTFPSIPTAGTASNGDGTYTLVGNVDFDINTFESGAIIGQLGDGKLDFPDGLTPADHFQAYADLSHDAFAIGNINTWQSPANVNGCAKCHGAPYRKHGNLEASIDGVPNFARCKTCHFDDRTGGHKDWQWMVDDPLEWATAAVLPPEKEVKYEYKAKLMNVVHMSHAMEFPFPQSMANCITCHFDEAGDLTSVLDNDNFKAETCKSCHPVDGTNAWPRLDAATPAEKYAQTHRAPPIKYLWAREGVESFHNIGLTCTNCHGTEPGVPSFAELHTGYDTTVYDENGVRYADVNTVSVDSVTRSGNLLTVNFSATNPDIVPTLAISFYGWDSKHYIVPAHERDGNRVDEGCNPTSSRPGCNIEWSPGSTKPFFTEDDASVAGDWMVTFDMSLFQAYKTDPIPDLIADGVVKYAEIAILPRLTLPDERRVNLEAVSTTYDLGGSIILPDYYQGADAAVDLDRCKACHDNVTVLVHNYTGRFGDSMQVCKSCHATTYEGGHLEMQSRSIDAYVHAIHRMQPLDEVDVFTGNDPVFNARNEHHKEHVFPYFTTLACEACHVTANADPDAGPVVPVTYNVPDQSKSMPGAKSGSWEFQAWEDGEEVYDFGREIGLISPAVQGAASRSCGSCHRAEWIKEDHAGDLASFDAHTGTNGTHVDNYPVNDDGDNLNEEPVLFGVIYKIMSLFE